MNKFIQLKCAIKKWLALVIFIAAATPFYSLADQWGDACATNPAGTRICANSLNQLTTQFNSAMGIVTEWSIQSSSFGKINEGSPVRLYWWVKPKPKPYDEISPFFYAYTLINPGYPSSCNNGCDTEDEIVSYLASEMPILKQPGYTYKVVGSYTQNFTNIGGPIFERYGGVWVGSLDFSGDRFFRVYYNGAPTSYGYRLNKFKSFTCRGGAYAPRVGESGFGEDALCGGYLFSVNQAVLQKQTCPVNENPCYPATGDKARFEMDFEFAGRPFVRNYHSARQLNSPGMSQGWSFTYGGWAAIDGSYEVDERGYAQIYGPAIGSTRASLTSQNRYMEQTATGFTSRSEGGIYRDYDFNGRLVGVREPAAPQRDVSIYRDNLNRISALVDSRGSLVSLEYNGAGLIASISLPDGGLISYQYNENGDLSIVQLSDGSTRQYVYDEPDLSPSPSSHLLTGIIDENLIRFATFSYDARQRVSSSTLSTAEGNVSTTSITYSNGQAVVATDGLGVRTIRYDSDGNVLSSSTPLSSRYESYSYDANGYLSGAFINGVTSSYTNNASGQRIIEVLAQGTPEQRRIETDWSSSLNVPVSRRVFDKGGVLVSSKAWTYNSRGQVLTASQAMKSTTRVTTNSYCEQAHVAAGTCPRVGLLISVNGPRTDVADVTTYAYYSFDHPNCAVGTAGCIYRKGDLWKITNAIGHITEVLSYDDSGRPNKIKDSNGVVTETTYNQRGWLTSKTVKGAMFSQDRSTLMEYGSTGAVKRVIQEDGSFTQFDYDAAHRLTGVRDSEGNEIVYALDSAGKRAGEDTLDSNGVLTRRLSRVHNELGQVESQSDAYGNSVGYIYDASGNTISKIDALGSETANTFDSHNRLVRTIQDAGGIAASTFLQYDALDNVTRVVDAKGLATDYVYNGLGELKQLSSPDSGITTYTYDSGGNKKTQVDARGVTATYSYDALNRPTSVAYRNATYNVSYQYDAVNATCSSGETYAVGRLNRITDASGSTQYCYTRFGQLARKVQVTNGRTFVTRYVYDDAGRQINIVYPDGTVADYVRDGEGRVDEIGVTAPGGSRKVVVTGVAYAPFGPTTGWTYGNGRMLLRSLNLNYQPDTIHDSGVGGLSLKFHFNPGGNLVLLQDAAQNVNLAQYDYDALHRLEKTMDGPTGVAIETYVYDATGNRLSVTNAGLVKNYVYPVTSHRLESVAGVARTYDSAGNTTKVGAGPELIYGDNNRLVQLKISNKVVSMNYMYNGKGEQVRSFANSAGGVYYVYDEAGHLLGEYNNDGAVLRQTIWLDDLPVGVLQGVGDNLKLHYVEPDHLGTPRVVIDGSRDVPIWEWSFKGEAFGATPPNQDPDGDGVVFDFDLRYPGQRHDISNGFNYNYLRDYDSATGRYLESDPIGLHGGLSTYGYAALNPLMNFDATGQVHTSGFSSVQLEKRVLIALMEAREKIANCKMTSCYPGLEDYHMDDADRSFILNRLMNMEVRFSSTNTECGSAVLGQSTLIELGPKAFDESRCGPLASTLAHEANHLDRFDGSVRDGEKRSRYIEKVCFGYDSWGVSK